MGTESFNDDQESGGSLRKTLEETLKERNELASQLVTYRAQDLVASKQWQHVTAEDLKGVKLEELEARGTELEVTKAALKESVLKEILEKQGIKGDDLQQAIEQLIGKTVGHTDDTTAALARMRAATATQGSSPGKIEPHGVFGASRIRAALGD